MVNDGVNVIRLVFGVTLRHDCRVNVGSKTTVTTTQVRPEFCLTNQRMSVRLTRKRVRRAVTNDLGLLVHLVVPRSLRLAVKPSSSGGRVFSGRNWYGRRQHRL
jgi:hypothetical protein